MSREIPPSLKHEIKVAGLESCRALFQARPRDVTRVYVIERMQREVVDILRYCEKHDIEWYDVSIHELAAFTETMRHDGICIVARKKPPTPANQLEQWSRKQSGALALVLLDGVKNPNNVGAVARTCAYFGVRYLVTTGETPGFSQAAVRVAQGATEAVELVQLRDARPLSAIATCGITLVTTSSHGGTRLDAGPLPERALFCFGGENAGVSPEIARLATHHIAIPGAGALESLNLAQATAILLWEHWRQFRGDAARPAPKATSRGRK